MISFENDGLVASGTNGIELLKISTEGKIELIRKICNEDVNTSVIANKKLYSGGAKGKLLVHDLSGSLLCEIEPHSEAIQWYANNFFTNNKNKCFLQFIGFGRTKHVSLMW